MSHKNLTVAELIAELQKQPQDSVVEAYEGESIGIRIEHVNGGGFDFIDTAVWTGSVDEDKSHAKFGCAAHSAAVGIK